MRTLADVGPALLAGLGVSGSTDLLGLPAVRKVCLLVVAAQGSSVVIRSKAESRLSRFVGHHGSLSDAEQLVPLLVAANGRGEGS
ncbi:hypothetical protein GCM10027269_67990 [Kribbella endophytica]